MTNFNQLIVLLVIALGLLSAPTTYAFDVDKFVPEGKVVGSFPGPSGWTIYVVENKNGIRVNWWEDQNGIVVIGKVFDQNKRDIYALAQEKYQANEVKTTVIAKIAASKEQLAKAAPQTKASSLGVFNHLEALPQKNYTSSIVGSPNGRKMYFFYDYNCPYCASSKEGLEASKDLNAEIVWVPVGIVNKQTSAVFGAAVLDGELSIDGIAKVIPSVHPQVSSASLEAVKHNTRLVRALPNPRAGTPTIVYKAANGEIVSKVGLQRDSVGSFVKSFMEAG